MRRLLLVLLVCVVAVGCGHAKKKAAVHSAATNAPNTPLVIEGANQGAYPTLAKPPAAVVKLWPSSWCRVRKGMTLLQIEKLMGVPQLANGKRKVTLQEVQTARVAVWQSDGSKFTARFDSDHKATSLSGRCAKG